MFLKSSLLFVYTETPLHAGTGAGLGPVDLPIQRERTTDYPIVQASGVKGALRSEAGGDGAIVNAIFGPQRAEHAGALSPGDARILLFPVRSLVGVFAWTTCVDVLARFSRDALMAGVSLTVEEEGQQVPLVLPSPPASDTAYASGQGVMPNGDNSVVLEEFSFRATTTDIARRWAAWLSAHALPAEDGTPEYGYWRQRLLTSLVILPSDAFSDFALHATEVVTRVRLTQQKTVDPRALWTEEHLPSDTLLYAPVHATRLRMNGNKPPALVDPEPDQEASKVLAWAADRGNIPHRLQMGGDETVGRGMVHLRWCGGA
jgi:CRISPR-associated protein Cmr4